MADGAQVQRKGTRDQAGAGDEAAVQRRLLPTARLSRGLKDGQDYSGKKVSSEEAGKGLRVGRRIPNRNRRFVRA